MEGVMDMAGGYMHHGGSHEASAEGQAQVTRLRVWWRCTVCVWRCGRWLVGVGGWWGCVVWDYLLELALFRSRGWLAESHGSC